MKHCTFKIKHQLRKERGGGRGVGVKEEMKDQHGALPMITSNLMT